ncbi:LysR family transcriptional regulator [Polymorphobacter sp.]|uniref:LysR family transcriptional regulator n=1 Tax=Polymorphobacter sp. TaxID=1909290 RepID=UPI003F6FF827
MKRTHLPLNALRVLDAAARHLSFTRAADELAVTPAAVGQQIRALEETLGVILFRRLARGLELTPEAERALPLLREGFRQFEESVRILQEGQASNVLTIAAPRDLTAKWLSARLAAYAARVPGKRFVLNACEGVPDFSEANLDLALYFGDEPDAEGIHGRAMGAETLVLVATAGPAADLPRLAHPLDRDAPGPLLSDVGLALDAALAGLGPVLVPSLLAAPALATGALVALADPVAVAQCWWLVAPTPQWRQPKVRSLVEFLLG